MSLCPVHDAVVVYAEDGIGLCYGCIRDLKEAVELAHKAESDAISERIATMMAEPTPYEEHRDHDKPRAWCFYCKRAEA